MSLSLDATLQRLDPFDLQLPYPDPSRLILATYQL